MQHAPWRLGVLFSWENLRETMVPTGSYHDIWAVPVIFPSSNSMNGTLAICRWCTGGTLYRACVLSFRSSGKNLLDFQGICSP